MKFEKKCEKLGITQDVKQILEEAELYNPETDKLRIVELTKMRNWEIQEEIVNFFNGIDEDGNEVEINHFYCNLNNLCETFGFSRNRLSEWYARAIAEWGYSLAYAINEDIVLIIDG